MKTPRIWLCFSFILVAGALSAQDAAPPAADVTPPPAKPGENVVIHLQGKYQGVPIDAKYVQDTFAGGQATATHDWMADYQPGRLMFITISTTVKAAENGHLAQFTVDARVPVESPATLSNGATGGAVTSTISYHSIKMQTSALLQPGQPVALFDNGDTLTATVEKLPGTASAAGFPSWGNAGKLDANLKAFVKITHADGTVSNITTAFSGNQVNFSTIAAMVDVPGGNPQPLIQNLTLQFRREPDGLGVHFTLGKSVPTVSSATRSLTTGSAAATVTYRSLTTSCDVAIKKLDEPIALFSSSDESITLTISRADK